MGITSTLGIGRSVTVNDDERTLVYLLGGRAFRGETDDVTQSLARQLSACGWGGMVHDYPPNSIP